MIIKKLIRKDRALTVKASVWYTLSNICARGFSVLLTPLFTRMLTPMEYGIYPLYVSWMGIFTVIGSFEIPGSVMYRTLSKFKDSEDAVVSSALSMEALLALLFFTIYIILRSRINAITSLSTLLTLLLILQVFLTAVEGIHFAKKRYSYDYKEVSCINIITGVATPALAILLISAGAGGISRVIAPIIVTALFAVPIIFISIKKSCRPFSLDKWKYLLKISLPMLPHYLALSLIAGADKIIITHTMGEGAIGKYSVAYSIGFMISLITNGLSLAISPWMLRKLGEGEENIINKKLSLITDTITALTLLFLALTPEIFAFAATREYADAFSVIYPIGISVVFLFLSGILSNAILHYEKPFKITVNSLVTAAMFLPLAFILIERCSYIGGGLATLLSYIVMFILNFISFKKESGYNILNANNCLINSGKLLFFGFLLYWARNAPVSRILISLSVVIMLLPKIKNALKIKESRE